MAGSPDDTGAPGDGAQYPGDASGQINPALSQVVTQQTTPEAQQWTADAANRIQDYVTQRAILSQNQTADQQFTQNLTDTRDALVGMVQRDPGAMDLAMDLGTHTAYGLASQHENLGEDLQSQAASGLESDFHTAIVHAGIQKLAETDKGQALEALDKYGDYLPPEEKGALANYAEVQDNMRTQDTAAMTRQATIDASVQGYKNASGYLHSMIDPNTIGFRAPPGFLQNLLADTTVALPTRLALQAGYSMLNQNGDVKSDPHIVTDFLLRIADNVTPLRPLNSNPQSVAPYGVGGETGNLLRQMIGPAYTTPHPPVRFFTPDKSPDNDNG